MIRGVDSIGVGVGAVILNTRNEVLVTQRGPKARNERGFWEFPGGAVELGETLESALRREILEEFGVEIEIIQLLDIVDHILPDEKQHWVSPTYICRITRGIPTIMEPDKCSAIKWCSIAKIPDHLSIVSQENLIHLRAYLSNHNPDNLA